MAGMLSLLALQSVASRSAQLQELEGKLASETVCTTKYRRMVGEIGKLIDWAHSTSPLPPTLGGRTSPAGYSSVMGFGSSRCVLGARAGLAHTQAACAQLVAAICRHHAWPLGPSSGLSLPGTPSSGAHPHCRLFGGGGSGTVAVSPLGDATNMWGLPGSASRRASTSPSKQRQVQVPSPAGRTPLPSPSLLR